MYIAVHELARVAQPAETAHPAPKPETQCILDPESQRPCTPHRKPVYKDSPEWVQVLETFSKTLAPDAFVRCMRVQVGGWGLGVGGWELGFGALGFGGLVWGQMLGSEVCGLALRVWTLGVGVWGLGFGVRGSGFDGVGWLAA